MRVLPPPFGDKGRPAQDDSPCAGPDVFFVVGCSPHGLPTSRVVIAADEADARAAYNLYHPAEQVIRIFQ
jgi:hypothetical protein